MKDRAIEWLREILADPRQLQSRGYSSYGPEDASIVNSIIVRIEAADRLADSATVEYDAEALAAYEAARAVFAKAAP